CESSTNVSAPPGISEEKMPPLRAETSADALGWPRLPSTKRSESLSRKLGRTYRFSPFGRGRFALHRGSNLLGLQRQGRVCHRRRGRKRLGDQNQLTATQIQVQSHIRNQ